MDVNTNNRIRMDAVPPARPVPVHRTDPGTAAAPAPVDAFARAAEALKERRAAEAASKPDLKFTMRTVDADAKFAVHEATNSVMVTIVDRSTGEVIREIPSRRHLDLVAALAGKGNLLDTSR